jgi:hypothetical protein
VIRVAVALLHHPVLDRQGDIVTTAITNLDLHDIARSSYTYGVTPFFVSHPVQAQRELARRVREHWVNGSGARRIPDRKPPMTQLNIVESLDQAMAQLEPPVALWATSAKAEAGRLTYVRARELLATRSAGSVLIALGTGWGLADEVFQRAEHILAPIESPREDGYNHLSVRAAAAIIFDRLVS